MSWVESWNSKITNWNKAITSTNQNKLGGDSYNNTLNEETNIKAIRSKLPFSDIVFRFPVTDKHTTIRMPAFLTSHSDSFTVGWNPEQVYGRPDPIPIYRNTQRTITLGFKIPNQDFESANENFLSLGVLIKNLYPAYKSFGSADIIGAFRDILSGLSPNQTIVGAPLTRIKFANLICNSDIPDLGLLGTISSLSITMDIEGGYLIFNGPNENESLMFPRALNFNINFNPLHEHKLGWNTSNEWLGKNKDNYPYATRTSNTSQGSQGVNLLGSAISGDSGGIVRSIFGGR